jgi:hypothetical protein
LINAGLPNSRPGIARMRKPQGLRLTADLCYFDCARQ